MGQQERETDEAATTKPEGDKKLTDLAADEKDKDVKGGGSKLGGGPGGP